MLIKEDFDTRPVKNVQNFAYSNNTSSLLPWLTPKTPIPYEPQSRKNSK